MALVAVLLLAVFFKPPTRAPAAEAVDDAPVGAASPAQP
jgi:hypothetical protein